MVTKINDTRLWQSEHTSNQEELRFIIRMGNIQLECVFSRPSNRVEIERFGSTQLIGCLLRDSLWELQRNQILDFILTKQNKKKS